MHATDIVRLVTWIVTLCGVPSRGIVSHLPRIAGYALEVVESRSKCERWERLLESQRRRNGLLRIRMASLFCRFCAAYQRAAAHAKQCVAQRDASDAVATRLRGMRAAVEAALHGTRQDVLDEVGVAALYRLHGFVTVLLLSAWMLMMIGLELTVLGPWALYAAKDQGGSAAGGAGRALCRAREPSKGQGECAGGGQLASQCGWLHRRCCVGCSWYLIGVPCAVCAVALLRSSSVVEWKAV